ncbi:MAG: dTDP-4-dehydrorhamnose 3,5-epimerase family protein [Thermocrispum sp.]
MQVRELAVPGAFEFTPRSFPDHRGRFVAPYQETAFVKAVGHPLRVAQTNHSVSARGVIRGVHFADTPPGQAKYLYCVRGEVLDVVVDLRVGSPTFGSVDTVRLSGDRISAVYLPEGLGHAFLALADDSVITYYCSGEYNLAGEHGVHPLDPELALPWPAGIEPVLSDKDGAAPTLAQAREQGLLPGYAACMAWYERLRTTS